MVQANVKQVSHLMYIFCTGRPQDRALPYRPGETAYLDAIRATVSRGGCAKAVARSQALKPAYAGLQSLTVHCVYPPNRELGLMNSRSVAHGGHAPLAGTELPCSQRLRYAVATPHTA
jgi:hypothetical protein